MDQVELDAAYDQSYYAPLADQIRARFASNSELVRARLGSPRREAYGPTAIERLDIYRTNRPKAPIFVYVHGGAWLHGFAMDYAFPAEMFVNAGAHYVVPDFVAVDSSGKSYVVNWSNASLEVFAAGANGTAPFNSGFVTQGGIACADKTGLLNLRREEAAYSAGAVKLAPLLATLR